MFVNPPFPARLAVVTLTCLLVAACSDQVQGTPEPAPSDTREFKGRMTVSGSRQTLLLQDQRLATTFRLGGSLLLSGADRPNLGFKVDIIGFSDSTTGMMARSVWTDERGERVYSELRAVETGPGKPVDGAFTGGTGRYTGLTGNYRFSWNHMTDSDDSGFGARVTDLHGSAILQTPIAAAGRKP